MDLVFATNNAHKLEEIRRIVGDGIRILSLSDIGCHDDIPETAETLEGNALQKARWVKERYGYDCFADYTGLMVDALDGAPGIDSARYAGPQCDAEANMELVLKRLEGIPDDRRTAAFHTVIALLQGDGTHIFTGSVHGRIAREKHGTNGFGYDPVFMPEDTGLTFAQLGVDVKNRISHRARAVQKLVEFLKNGNIAR
mgnify:FL=1